MTEGQGWGSIQKRSTDFKSFINAKPLYDIHKPTVKSSYVNFSIPKSEKNAYSYIDAIYNLFGIEKAQLILTEEHINVRIKMNSWKVTNDSEAIQRLLELNSYSITLISDIYSSAVYQLHREPTTWKWQDEPDHFEFKVIEPTEIHKNIALNLSLSATINNSRITKVLGEGTSIWTVTIPSPNNDFLKEKIN